jgi:uncharacterized protein YjiS (DUF1127 family)
MQFTMILPSPGPAMGGAGGYRMADRPNRLRAMLREAARTRRRISLVAVLRRMAEAIRTRRQLAAMDDRMLSDLAISRADALREAARGPWDATPAAWHPR